MLPATKLSPTTPDISHKIENSNDIFCDSLDAYGMSSQ